MIEKDFHKEVVGIEGKLIRVMVYDNKVKRPFVVYVCEFNKEDSLIAKGTKVSAQIVKHVREFFNDDFRMEIKAVDDYRSRF